MKGKRKGGGGRSCSAADPARPLVVLPRLPARRRPGVRVATQLLRQTLDTINIDINSVHSRQFGPFWTHPSSEPFPHSLAIGTGRERAN